MTTKIRHLYPTQDFPAMTPSNDGIPLRWLETLVQDARNRILLGAVTEEDKARVMREADSAMIYGTEHLRITYTDELTPLESVTDELNEWKKLAEKSKSFVDASGKPTVSEEQLVQFLKQLSSLLG